MDVIMRAPADRAYTRPCREMANKTNAPRAYYTPTHTSVSPHGHVSGPIAKENNSGVYSENTREHITIHRLRGRDASVQHCTLTHIYGVSIQKNSRKHNILY